MTTFVLLHGAWHGGWCWTRVRSQLQAHGHQVHTPTFTGVSDRAHLLHPGVGLHTHTEDVVRLLEAEDLHDVILVGHSYAGLVVSQASERIPARIARRVYLDAFLPRDGEAGIDLLPEQAAHHYRDAVAGPGFGWLIPPRALDVLGVRDPADLAWLQPRLTPHPWLSYTEPVTLGAGEESTPAAYIECVGWMRVFAPHAARARELGWPTRDLDTGHEAMVTAPDHLTRALLEIAQPGPTPPRRQA